MMRLGKPSRHVYAALFLTVIATIVAGAHLMLPPYATSEILLAPPSLEHWLGTNDIGQDVLVGVVRAAPATVGIALATAAIATALAVLAATVVVVSHRAIGHALMRIVDVLQIIPSILIFLFVAAWHRPDTVGIISLLAATTWYDDVRVVRVLIERETSRESFLIARKLGASNAWCMRRHILPALREALAALFTQNSLQAAMRATGLGFLGLTDPRLLTWGGMMHDALDHIQSPAALWLLTPPLLALAAFLYALLTLTDPQQDRARLVEGQAV